jgi:hypothetical protein
MKMIIINEDMPHNCWECEINTYHHCNLTDEDIDDYTNGDEREPHCPLHSSDDFVPRKKVEQISRDCWDAGVNMTDEYQGVWTRFRDIEKFVNRALGEEKR